MSSIITLSILGIALLFMGLYKKQNWLFPTGIIGLLAGSTLLALEWNKGIHYYNDMLFFDNYAIAFGILALLGSAIIIVSRQKSFEAIGSHLAEYVALIIFSLVGILCMMSFQNMAMLFIGIEITSICMYIMAGIKRNDIYSNEASIKYLLMGAFATGFLLFGITLVYGATRSFNLTAIADMSTSPNNIYVLYAGIAMMLVGMSFKIGAAPFHFWAPDVYDGSPTIVTAYMSTIVKVAGFAAIYRLFNYAFAAQSEYWSVLFIGICILTLLIGNITAVYQQSFKRMLAYSGISHTGYIVLALLTATDGVDQTIFFYSVAYILASSIAFLILIKVEESTKNEDINSFNGLYKLNPWMAFCLTISMASLAGLPLTAGFIGKFSVFTTAIKEGYLGISIFAIVHAMISIYYYFKVIIAMYFKSNDNTHTMEGNWAFHFAIGFATIATLILGIYPNLLLTLII